MHEPRDEKATDEEIYKLWFHSCTIPTNQQDFEEKESLWKKKHRLRSSSRGSQWWKTLDRRLLVSRVITEDSFSPYMKIRDGSVYCAGAY